MAIVTRHPASMFLLIELDKLAKLEREDLSSLHPLRLDKFIEASEQAMWGNFGGSGGIFFFVVFPF